MSLWVGVVMTATRGSIGKPVLSRLLGIVGEEEIIGKPGVAGEGFTGKVGVVEKGIVEELIGNIGVIGEGFIGKAGVTGGGNGVG